MHPTPYSEINEILATLLSQIHAILGAKLEGLYLYGSLVAGDFDPNISDIDLLAVTSTMCDEQELDLLKRMHDDLADEYRRWKDRIEVQYVTVNALQTFKSKPSMIAAISPGEPFHTKEAGKDWMVNWYVVQEKGRVLFGPSPKTFIDPISKAEFLQDVEEHAYMWRDWIGNISKRPGSQAYAVLTLCRALYTYIHGEQVSKKQAAEWAQGYLPQWAPVIQNALRRRAAQWEETEEHPETFPETVRFVNYVIDQIERRT